MKQTDETPKAEPLGPLVLLSCRRSHPGWLGPVQLDSLVVFFSFSFWKLKPRSLSPTLKLMLNKEGVVSSGPAPTARRYAVAVS